jgi:hypothetical protein
MLIRLFKPSTTSRVQLSDVRQEHATDCGLLKQPDKHELIISVSCSLAARGESTTGC